MHKPIYQKFLFYVSLFGFVVSIVVGFYDVIFGYLFEFCHLLFEIIEMALDKLVEETFHTELHETQLIVFYILVVIGGFGIYFVWKALVLIVGSISHSFSQECLVLKEAISSDWEAMTIINKVVWVCVFLLINYLASFLFF
jgi:flagellar biosynthesis protein FlhB